MAQFDATRDLKGTFYAPGDIRAEYHKLRKAIEERLLISLKSNGNSFNTCFQYIEAESADSLYRRIKIYFKGLAMLQSQTPSMRLGMNTNALFAPTMRMLQALRETMQQGLTRIEISYYA